jgi:16S rRNA (cytosine1402-N4)-methyltransferase
MIQPGGRIVALDRDPLAIERARSELAMLPLIPVLANFSDLRMVLDDLGVRLADRLVLDLGFCSDQMQDPARGLSFRLEGPLDMRFDPTAGITAADLLHRLAERELAELIFRFGEERFSRRIARAIVSARRQSPIKSTLQLADIVRRAYPFKGKARIDPATRTFQALRIAVNQELPALAALLAALPRCVRPGGRVAIISFHSLEDRLAKTAFKDQAIFEIITRKPVRPSETELAANPRSRSARLRIAQLRGQVP